MIKNILPKINTTKNKVPQMMAAVAVTIALAMNGYASAAPRDVTEKQAVVENLAASLEKNFVFPEIGKKYAQYLRNYPLQNMDDMSPKQFASALTSGLQKIHKDSHLRIIPPTDEPVSTAKEKKTSPRIQADSIEAALWLAPQVAYIRFNLFPGNAKALLVLDTFIQEHKNAQTLIIDARGHRGGGLAEMDLMFSHMFPTITDLAYMETRKAVDEAGGSPIQDGITVKTIKGPEGVVRRKHMAVPHDVPLMLNTDIYILTSGYTASAAEHLSMVMKRTRRGIVIGEHTRGGAHYGGTDDLGNGYAAFVPVGRTFNPDTQKDWEGTGITPDIQTSSERALIMALAHIGISDDEALKINRRLNFKPPTRPE